MLKNEIFAQLGAMTKKEWIVFTRYPVRIIATLANPLFIILFVGFTIASFSSSRGVSIAASMFISIIGFVYLTISSYTAQAVVEDQQQGMIESLFLTPIPKFIDILAKMIVRYGFVSVTIFVYYAILRYLFGDIPLNNMGLGIVLVGSLIGESLFVSFAIAGLTLKYKDTAVRVGFVIPFLMLIFSGMFIPLSVLPTNARVIALLLPFTYTIDALRGVMVSPGGFVTLLPIPLEVAFSIVLGVILPILGALYYLRVERSARYNGTLLEY